MQSFPHTQLRNIYNHSNENENHKESVKQFTEFIVDLKNQKTHVEGGSYVPKPIEQIHFKLNESGPKQEIYNITIQNAKPFRKHMKQKQR